MIRYDVDENTLKDAVTLEKSSWLRRAKEREDKFIAAQKYEESSGIWSEIKPVFITLQNNKCIFCERRFESREYGKIEHDLEHFRPKSSVKIWPPSNSEFSYSFETGPASSIGYYWLAYDLLNYAASCKVCNSTLKSNSFPISGPRENKVRRPPELEAEEAFLCYPIGSFDADPEDILTFDVTTVIPKKGQGHDRRRAEVIIDFFRLNKRELLHNERAQMIILAGDALRDIERGENVTRAQKIVELACSPRVPHTACTRVFCEMWEADIDRAKIILNECKDRLVDILNS